MKTVYCDKEDYSIEIGLDSVSVFRKDHTFAIANFKTKEQAQEFVDRRTNPQPIAATFFEDVCRCGWTKAGWDYRILANGTIAEFCNSCKMPLRDYVRAESNTESLKDFSLDDFISGL